MSMMTEPKPKLDAPTLRWAAQLLRGFAVPHPPWWRRAVNNTYMWAAQSLDDWATDAELASSHKANLPETL